MRNKIFLVIFFCVGGGVKYGDMEWMGTLVEDKGEYGITEEVL